MLNHWPQQWLQHKSTKEALFILPFFFHVSNHKNKYVLLEKKNFTYLRVCVLGGIKYFLFFFLGEVCHLHLTQIKIKEDKTNLILEHNFFICWTTVSFTACCERNKATSTKQEINNHKKA